MLNKFYFLAVLLAASTRLFSQHYADKWYFGGKAAIDFTGGAPVALATSEMTAGEGSASIADPSTGALLFYTDGITVWNADNAVMPNGTDLMGGLSSTQPALIVPKPESDNEFYIFTTDQIGGSLGLRYSIVDRTLDGGNGDVTTKNVLMTTPVTEKITAVQQPGTVNVWLLAHGWDDNAFYAYRITPSGIDAPVVTNTGIVHTDDVIQNSYGQMKFNTCGDQLALAAGYLDKVEIFDFSTTTGIVSNPRTISYADHVYGVEFSSNGNVLYVSTYDPSATLIQYDLTIANTAAMIAAAEIVSSTPDTYAMQRGPDGKIYVCKSFSQYLGVINSPNTIGGTACNYVDAGLDLDPTFMGINSGIGLPDLVTSFMGGTAACPGSTNALGEATFALACSVFPNPSGSGFTFSSQQNGLQVVITEVSGKQLASFSGLANGTEVHFGNDYAPGIYLIKAADATGNTHILKILKN
jgi:hypothetical protein